MSSLPDPSSVFATPDDAIASYYDKLQRSGQGTAAEEPGLAEATPLATVLESPVGGHPMSGPPQAGLGGLGEEGEEEIGLLEQTDEYTPEEEEKLLREIRAAESLPRPQLPREVLDALAREADEVPSFAQALSHAVLMMSNPALGQSEVERHETKRRAARDLLLSLSMEEMKLSQQERHDREVSAREALRQFYYGRRLSKTQAAMVDRQLRQQRAKEIAAARSSARQAAIAAGAFFTEDELGSEQGRDAVIGRALAKKEGMEKRKAAGMAFLRAGDRVSTDELLTALGVTREEALRDTSLAGAVRAHDEAVGRRRRMEEEKLAGAAEMRDIRRRYMEASAERMEGRSAAEIERSIASFQSDLRLYQSRLTALDKKRFVAASIEKDMDAVADLDAEIGEVQAAIEQAEAEVQRRREAADAARGLPTPARPRKPISQVWPGAISRALLATGEKMYADLSEAGQQVDPGAFTGAAVEQLLYSGRLPEPYRKQLFGILLDQLSDGSGITDPAELLAEANRLWAADEAADRSKLWPWQKRGRTTPAIPPGTQPIDLEGGGQ